MTTHRSSRTLIEENSPSAVQRAVPRILRRGLAGLVLAISLACVSAGCSSPGADAPQAASTQPAATPDTDRAAVERAYRSAIEAFEAALMDPSKGNDELELWWADPALGSVRSQVNTWAGFGQALRYPEQSTRSIEVRSVSVSGDTAEVRACVVDDGQRVDLASGDVLSGDTSTVLERAELRRSGRGWTVSERSELRRTTGASACDID